MCIYIYIYKLPGFINLKESVVADLLFLDSVVDTAAASVEVVIF